jgi:uncharacterized cysteine cluster protein YcgN (CxxCxxCC family)
VTTLGGARYSDIVMESKEVQDQLGDECWECDKGVYEEVDPDDIYNTRVRCTKCGYETDRFKYWPGADQR